MKRISIILVLVFLGLITLSAKDHDQDNLSQVLEYLSHKHNVRFAFSPSLTDKVFPKVADLDGPLEEVLDRVLKDTEFSYRIIRNRYYLIYKDSTKQMEEPPSVPEMKDTVFREQIFSSNVRVKMDSLIEYDFPLSDLTSNPYTYIHYENQLPSFAIKSNLLYDATLSANFGVEFALSRRLTADLSIDYNNWTYSDNRKMKHFLFQPELRLWNCDRFCGGFFGVHPFVGTFNWGGMLPWGFKNGKMFGAIENSHMTNHRYQGQIYGVGVGYGYHWILDGRWSLEAEIGAGYARLNYDEYLCQKCGDKTGHDHANYFGPTKAALNLIFLF